MLLQGRSGKESDPDVLYGVPGRSCPRSSNRHTFATPEPGQPGGPAAPVCELPYPLRLDRLANQMRNLAFPTVNGKASRSCMITFNTVLRDQRIDPSTVQLVRHQDTRHAGRSPYALWRSAPDALELYQRIQRREGLFRVGGLIASFVAPPTGDTLFVGLYRVSAVGVAPEGTTDPLSGRDCSNEQLYDISPDPRLSEYKGLLVIDWGLGFRSWVQRADRQDKPVQEIRRAIADPPFPGFAEFRSDIAEIESIPPGWQEVLRSVKGVCVLACKETGKLYVGSAKGEESLWGRFRDHASTGHGGNVELKRRGRREYQVSVLEVAGTDQRIERLEEAWKRKLLSREFGLNDPREQDTSMATSPSPSA
jgi:GIY-YIG catalytic domain